MTEVEDAAWAELVELINSAQFADTDEKIKLLKGVQEIVVHRQPGLFQQVLPELAHFQRDNNASVRRLLLDILEKGGIATSQPVVRHATLALLLDLAGDTASTAVAKRAIAACTVQYRAAFTAVVEGTRLPGYPAELEQLWAQLQQVKVKLCATAVEHRNDGVRLVAVKFLELAALLLTSDLPRPHALLQPGMLASEAQAAVAQLTGALKPPGVFDLPGTVAVVAFRAAAAIATQRTTQLGRILPTLLSVAHAAGKLGKAEGSTGVAPSVQAAIKGALVSMLRCRLPAAAPWIPKVTAAMRAIGEGEAADAEARRNDKLSKRERAEADGAQDNGSKRQRTNNHAAPAQQPGSNGNSAASRAAPTDPRAAPSDPRQRRPSSQAQQPQQQQAPHQQQQQQQQPLSDRRTSAEIAQAPVKVMSVATTPQHELDQVLAVIAHLLASQEHATCQAFVNGLPPEVVTDMVMASMTRLPRLEDLLPPGQQQQQQPQQAAGAGLASLVQGLAQPAQPPGAIPQTAPSAATPPLSAPDQSQPFPSALPQQLPPHSPAQLQSQAQPDRAPSPLPAGQPQQTGQVAAARDVSPPVVQEQRAGTPPPPPKAPARATPPPPAPPSIVPQPLSQSDMQLLRRGATTRILHASDGAHQRLRTTLLARLASLAPEGDRLADEILQHLLQDFHAHGGTALAMQWLYTLAAVHCRPSQPSSASAEPTHAEQDAQVLEQAPADDAADGNQAMAEAAEGTDVKRKRLERMPPCSLAVTPYETVLLALLEGLRDALPPPDRTLTQVIMEAPALPGVCAFLGELMQDGGEASLLALSTLWDVMRSRPLDRSSALHMVLEAAVHRDGELRSKAIRLTGNRLLPDELLAPEILAFAEQHLQIMVAGPPADAASAQPPEVKQEEDAVKPEEDADRVRRTAEAHALQHSELFCALCTRRPPLLRQLMQAFAQAKPDARPALHKNAPGLARVLGPGAEAMLQLVQQPPEGSQPLLLQMLYTVTETEPPPAELLQSCLAQHRQSGDARFLPIAFAGMPKAQITPLLPHVIQLEASGLRAALHRLLHVPSSSTGEPVMSASELLVGLHSITPTPAGPTVRQLIAAVDACVADRATFHADALASALQQLQQRTPLPVLFMRFAMQAQAACPQLAWLLLDILSALAGKAVWADPQQWRGWLLAAIKHAPSSFPAFLQLPLPIIKQVLEDEAVQAVPAPFKLALAEHARSGKNIGTPLSTLQLIEAVAARILAAERQNDDGTVAGEQQAPAMLGD